jgi:hypothetical protein
VCLIRLAPGCTLPGGTERAAKGTLAVSPKPVAEKQPIAPPSREHEQVPAPVGDAVDELRRRHLRLNVQIRDLRDELAKKCRIIADLKLAADQVETRLQNRLESLTEVEQALAARRT